MLHIGAVLFYRADKFDGDALLRKQGEQALRRLPGRLKRALVAKDLDRPVRERNDTYLHNAMPPS
jgi:hypothetical protein